MHRAIGAREGGGGSGGTQGGKEVAHTGHSVWHFRGHGGRGGRKWAQGIANMDREHAGRVHIIGHVAGTYVVTRVADGRTIDLTWED